MNLRSNLKNKAFLIVLLVFNILYLKSYAQAWLRYGAVHCIDQCFNLRPDAFYCSNGREYGYCCPDSSRAECREDAVNDITCS
jgi:hypothetical protein